MLDGLQLLPNPGLTEARHLRHGRKGSRRLIYGFPKKIRRATTVADSLSLFGNVVGKNFIGELGKRLGHGEFQARDVAWENEPPVETTLISPPISRKALYEPIILKPHALVLVGGGQFVKVFYHQIMLHVIAGAHFGFDQ